MDDRIELNDRDVAMEKMQALAALARAVEKLAVALGSSSSNISVTGCNFKVEAGSSQPCININPTKE